VTLEKIGADAIRKIYGDIRELPKLPEGWEYTGEFRVPIRGECSLDAHTFGISQWRSVGPDARYPPRLLVRRVKRVVGWTVRKLDRPPVYRERYIQTHSLGESPVIAIRQADDDSMYKTCLAISVEPIYE
jgi:hypothetical protein